MVDVDPFSGYYNGTIVRNNAIAGGFATGSPTSGGNTTDGDDSNDVIIKCVTHSPFYALIEQKKFF